MFKGTSGRVRLLMICAAGLVLMAAAETSWCQGLGLGHEMLREKGPLIANVVYSFRGDYPFDPSRWAESNYSMIDIGQGRQNIGQCEYYSLYWTLQGNDANELTPDALLERFRDPPLDYSDFVTWFWEGVRSPRNRLPGSWRS